MRVRYSDHLKSLLTLHAPDCAGPASSIILSKYTQAPKVDLAALESNHSIKQRLAAIGLDPMAEWVSYGCQTDKIPGSIIVACAAMFSAYLDDVPTEESHLDGTPYRDTDRLEDNLDSNGCVEYKLELEPCFRTAARYGDSCYAEHC